MNKNLSEAVGTRQLFPLFNNRKKKKNTCKSDYRFVYLKKMSTIVVLGAGIAGHTAVEHLQRKLKRKHQIIVITPNEYFYWIPSNIWVGVGKMTLEQVRFPLKPVYDKWKVTYYQAKATEIFPEGNQSHSKPFVRASFTDKENFGKTIEVEYDYLIIATGPKLNFDATPGLAQYSQSVCTAQHASASWQALQQIFQKAAKGERQHIVIGTGHPTATCQGAAFEYALNVASEVRTRKLEHNIDITWITNEYELGDFGMNGAFVRRNGYAIHTRELTESLLAEYKIRWIKRAGVKRLEPNKIYYENLDDGKEYSIDFDFAMLIPQFTGVDLKAFDKNNNSIQEKLFLPNGFVRVDADYTPKSFEQYSVDDWPSIYQNPFYQNIFAPGIAFAPPHSISVPHFSPNGTAIYAAPPRTGMPSGVMGKIVAQNIADKILKGQNTPFRHKASMGRMGAACIISIKYSLWSGLAAVLTVNPIVPDWKKYPDFGRNINYTIGEIGLAGHWTKLFLHYMFMYKAKGKPLWWLIPE